MRVAVTGASGLLGSHLVSALRARGDDVIRVVRRPAGRREAAWDPRAGTVEAARLEGLDAIVHLAGHRIDQRWSARSRTKIMASRRDGTRILMEAVVGLDAPPRHIVCQSAVGYYGDRGDDLLGEDAGPGGGFLAEVVQAWEAAAQPARDAGLRVAHPRTGIVLSRGGGALARMLLPFRLGLGGPVAGGRQWFPWIAHGDWTMAILHLLDERFDGPCNVAAPGIVTQGDFAKALGRVLHRPAVAPLPRAAVALMFGDMGREVLTFGQRVVTDRLAKTGFRWEHPGLEGALQAILARAPKGRNA